jgi:hypothetical protein
MTAVATIVLNDAQGTPVAHNFIPLGPDTNGVWWFEDQGTGSTAIGYNRLSISLVRSSPPTNGLASSANRVNRIKLTIHCPVLETLGTNDAGVTPPPTVAYVSRGMVEIISPERNALQNRKDLRKYLQFLLADTLVVAAVETLQNIY